MSRYDPRINVLRNSIRNLELGDDLVSHLARSVEFGHHLADSCPQYREILELCLWLHHIDNPQEILSRAGFTQQKFTEIPSYIKEARSESPSRPIPRIVKSACALAYLNDIPYFERLARGSSKNHAYRELDRLWSYIQFEDARKLFENQYNRIRRHIDSL